MHHFILVDKNSTGLLKWLLRLDRSSDGSDDALGINAVLEGSSWSAFLLALAGCLATVFSRPQRTKPQLLHDYVVPLFNFRTSQGSRVISLFFVF